MTGNNNHSLEDVAEKRHLKPTEQVPPGTAITDKADNVIQQRLKDREALKTFRLTRDPSNSFAIDMGDGSDVKDKRPISSEDPAGTCLVGTPAQIGFDKGGKVAPLAPSEETTMATKLPDPIEPFRHDVLGARHPAKEVQEATRQVVIFPHQGKEDQFVDYETARKAVHLAGLDKYHVPINIVGAILRNEQGHYKASDTAQDNEVQKTGTLMKDGHEDSTASIGPAQMQIRNIRHLINEKNSDGQPKYPFLQHMKDDPLRGALDKTNAALLAAAFLADNVEKLHLKPNEVTPECLPYLYNQDVHSYGRPKQYVACEERFSLAFQKIMHKDLEDENYPSPEVLKHSTHVANVMSNLAKIPIPKIPIPNIPK